MCAECPFFFWKKHSACRQCPACGEVLLCCSAALLRCFVALLVIISSGALHGRRKTEEGLSASEHGVRADPHVWCVACCLQRVTCLLGIPELAEALGYPARRQTTDGMWTDVFDSDVSYYGVIVLCCGLFLCYSSDISMVFDLIVALTCSDA